VSNFAEYSAYYDLLYRDKDYAGEAAYIASLIRGAHPTARTVLDLGCGTGRHAGLLQNLGYDICGVDMSAAMLAEARRTQPAITFHQGDARSFRLDQTFDAVVSLFHVASYQTTNRDFAAYLQTAKSLMAPGGVFIFDFWYGPAVLADPPAVRVKRLEDGQHKVTRIAEPDHDRLRNTVDVRYQILVESAAGPRQLSESHRMRYFFLPEIELFLENAGMTLRKITAWKEDRLPTAADWGACVIAGLE
jgi:SAM-dependent methyltransferase